MRNILDIMVMSVTSLIATVLLTHCGKESSNSIIADPSTCSVKAVSGGSEINCPDGTSSFVADGKDGAQGNAGVDGSSCSVTPDALGSTLTCTDGTTVHINNGVNGATGAQGVAGVQGVAGANGTAGTQITPVEFCGHGYVATYPSMFPEYGLVIDGVMFGVYSANGGFLSPLPPGVYSSNGINASCTFTINADNTVSD